MRHVLPLPDFSAIKMLVVGDVMLDYYRYGNADRISPEAPVQVVRIDKEVDCLGGAANVAANVASLGAQVTLIGLSGDDPQAKVLESLLGRQGITHQLVHVPGSRTIVKSRIVSDNQQLLRLDYENEFPAISLAEVKRFFNSAITQVDAVIFSDYAKGCLRNIRDLISQANTVGKAVFVDPKSVDLSIYASATMLTPNFVEFCVAAGIYPGIDVDEQVIVSAAEKIRARLQLEALLITRGEQGMTLVEKSKPAVRLIAQAHEVYDTTGAGDTVISVLASAYTCGQTFLQSMRLANAAAGLAVMKAGTTIVNVDELAHAAGGGDVSGVYSVTEIVGLVEQLRVKGQTIVVTNGCFDLLHLGHIEYLKEAALLGDKLIVLVNDDDSVRRLKGAGRPINRLNERMQLLVALEPVDCVVPFSDDTPESLIELIRPDVLVKGGDYKPEDIAGYDTVAKYGGNTIVLDYLNGYSTSELIKQIRK